MSPKSLAPVSVVRRLPPRTTHHRRSTREREDLLERFRRSGQSQKRFCQENGLSLSTLQYWLSRARLQGQPVDASFVQLPAPTVAACLPGARELPMGAVQIRLPSRIELQVTAGADPAWVGALLRGGARMLNLNENIRVYVKPGITDGRLGVYGLRGLVDQGLGLDVMAGDLFVFCNNVSFLQLGIADALALALGMNRDDGYK